MSLLPRPPQAASLVAMMLGGVAARIVIPDGRSRSIAVSMACAYQGLEKPRTFSSSGIMSRVSSVSRWSQRQMTRESLSSMNPRSRRRLPSR